MKLPLIPRWFRFLPFVFFAVHALSAADNPTFRRGVNLSHWLSQNYAPDHTYGASWFGESDIAWIAGQGYDHVRVPVDGRLWIKEDGSLDEAKVAVFDRLLGWVKRHHLNAVLDMHFLPGADFNNLDQDARVYTDLVLQEKVADFWRKVAKRYAGEGNYLRFEILNEPVAKLNEQLNPFQLRMLAAIRESNPTRVVYITCNRWSGWRTLKDVDVPADPNVAVTFHFYEPFVFTHQRATWVGDVAKMPAVAFPGRVPELKGTIPADHFMLESSGKVLSVAEDIDAPFAAVQAWAKEKAPGKEIYMGEFGAYKVADPASQQAWIEATVRSAEKHGFSWAVWDYKGGFAVRAANGDPTVVQKAIHAATK